MSRFTHDSVERVKEATDVVEVISAYTDLRRSGARFTGLCPFHDERTPSFSVDPQEKLYHCWVRGGRRRDPVRGRRGAVVRGRGRVAGRSLRGGARARAGGSAGGGAAARGAAERAARADGGLLCRLPSRGAGRRGRATTWRSAGWATRCWPSSSGVRARYVGHGAGARPEGRLQRGGDRGGGTDPEEPEGARSLRPVSLAHRVSDPRRARPRSGVRRPRAARRPEAQVRQLA